MPLFCRKKCMLTSTLTDRRSAYPKGCWRTRTALACLLTLKGLVGVNRTSNTVDETRWWIFSRLTSSWITRDHHHLRGKTWQYVLCNNRQRATWCASYKSLTQVISHLSQTFYKWVRQKLHFAKHVSPKSPVMINMVENRLYVGRLLLQTFTKINWSSFYCWLL